MAEDSENQSISSEYLQNLMMEEINDSMVARVEAKMQARIEAKLQARAGSSSNSRRYINRDHEASHAKLVVEYFAENPLYTDYQFRRRFRMRKHIFLQIVEALENWSPYFQLRRDAFGKVGLSPLQKCTTALRMLAYGSPADLMDESFGIAETTALECIIKFVQGIRHIYGEKYLRKPNDEDIQRLLQVGEARGFPGMLGSLDCMHWRWGNCPVAWKGSNNDLNVLNQSSLFTQVLQGRAPEVKFTINGSEYNMGYYLADGIYPEWATFVKTITLPLTEKDSLFAQHQEGARKDVECAFGILQKRWAIIRHPARLWDRQQLEDIMMACIILHNMIVEDERDSYQLHLDTTYEEGRATRPIEGLDHGSIHGFTKILEINI
ncbi:protein ALP1-like [Miscanthus floridulus]|uniref:protein ALP1-like n=1 Tax=Miscanthus floridulus TaxID=154761 RepID=UPI003457F808